MRFLIDSSLPRSVAALLRANGHEAIDARDIGLQSAPDSHIAQYARAQNLAIVSADFDFADIRVYPPADYPGIVIISPPENATVAVVLQLVARLSSQQQILAAMSGHLIIVDIHRIRIRPALP